MSEKGVSIEEETGIVRFHVYLPRRDYETLERVRRLTGKRSLAETLRAALRVYDVLQEGIRTGKHVVLKDETTETRVVEAS